MRVGDTVHRPTGPWTPSVHALLDYLAPRLPYVPRVRGYDEAGREVLDYLPGHVIDMDSDTPTLTQLRGLVTWTRQFHEVVSVFHHDGPWRYFEMPNPAFIGHNDLAPYNCCFDGDRLTGVFDWDLAGPTNALNELAFLAWNAVPLWRPDDPAVVARRLAVIAVAYGGPSALEILNSVPRRIQVMLDGIPRAAKNGDRGMANLLAQGEPERSAVSLEALVERMPGVRRELVHR